MSDRFVPDRGKFVTYINDDGIAVKACIVNASDDPDVWDLDVYNPKVREENRVDYGKSGARLAKTLEQKKSPGFFFGD